MFGYGKNELRGRNINLVIPQPFAEHHDNYVKNYINTGVCALRRCFACHSPVSQLPAHPSCLVNLPITAARFSTCALCTHMHAHTFSHKMPLLTCTHPVTSSHTPYVIHPVAGKGVILDKNSEFVALHKERYVFAVLIHVTRVMGMGQDSIFMGTVQVRGYGP